MAKVKKRAIAVGAVFDSANFGQVEVVSDTGWDSVVVRFLNTGFQQSATRSQIKKGQLMDRLAPVICGIGYMGGTKHKSKIGKRDNPHYTRWTHMLRRCYDQKTKQSMPTYDGCYVCDEWHNFQNYADWCDKNYIAGYQLDKDILIEGNKIYSPETCKFVSQQENTEKATAKTHEVISPCGKPLSVYNLHKFCKLNGLSSSNMRAVLAGRRDHHKGWTARQV